MKDIVRFDLVKINRGREKLCKCVVPHFEIDTENRIVLCQKCGAILDPFEALVKLAEHPEKMVEMQKRMKERIKAYKEEAEQERSKMIKSKVFRGKIIKKGYGRTKRVLFVGVRIQRNSRNCPRNSG